MEFKMRLAHEIIIGLCSIITALLVALIHGVKFRLELTKNGDGKSYLRYRIYIANQKNGE